MQFLHQLTVTFTYIESAKLTELAFALQGVIMFGMDIAIQVAALGIKDIQSYCNF